MVEMEEARRDESKLVCSLNTQINTKLTNLKS